MCCCLFYVLPPMRVLCVDVDEWLARLKYCFGTNRVQFVPLCYSGHHLKKWILNQKWSLWPMRPYCSDVWGFSINIGVAEVSFGFKFPKLSFSCLGSNLRIFLGGILSTWCCASAVSRGLRAALLAYDAVTGLCPSLYPNRNSQYI